MIRSIVKKFCDAGMKDHLKGGRVQEEVDLHRLFMLTSFYVRDGNGESLVSSILEEGKDLQYDQLKAEVSANLTEQLVTKCSAVRDAVTSASAANVGGSTPNRARAEAVNKSMVASLGFTCRISNSNAGVGSGQGLWVRGCVDPGEIVAIYPGVAYAIESLRHLPGWPKPGERKENFHNQWLMRRYDGTIIDATPWGRGTERAAAGAGGGVAAAAARVAAGQPAGLFGVWPGAPVDHDPADEPVRPTSNKRVGWYDDILNPILSKEMLRSAARRASEVERQNPLALGHFANHPPKGGQPNVVVASVDIVFPALFPAPGDEDDLDDNDRKARAATRVAARDLRRYLPTVGLGEWVRPLTLTDLVQNKHKRNAKGFLRNTLDEWFGDSDEGPKPDDWKKQAREKKRLDDLRRGKGDRSEGGDGLERGELVVPTLVLVAMEGIQDEEVFLNYRLSTHIPRPDWYHTVNMEEDTRRWAMDF